jgi:hypothetical protein
MTKVISVCNRDCDSHYYRRDEKGKILKGEPKVLRKGWAQYVEITTVNGKKVSVTRHGPMPS